MCGRYLSQASGPRTGACSLIWRIGDFPCDFRRRQKISGPLTRLLELGSGGFEFRARVTTTSDALRHRARRWRWEQQARRERGQDLVRDRLRLRLDLVPPSGLQTVNVVHVQRPRQQAVHGRADAANERRVPRIPVDIVPALEHEHGRTARRHAEHEARERAKPRGGDLEPAQQVALGAVVPSGDEDEVRSRRWTGDTTLASSSALTDSHTTVSPTPVLRQLPYAARSFRVLMHVRLPPTLQGLGH